MKYFTAVCVLLSCLTLVLGAASCGTKDTTAPSIPTEIDTTIPANDATPTFTWSAATDDDSGVDHYLVAVASAAVPTGAVLWVNVGNVTTYTVATALSDGSHTFVVKAVDKAGNEGGPCSLSFILDATPPSISSVAASGTSSSTVRITWTTNEPAIAKIEKRTDMYISTLRSHIEAMGGELEVIARFPDGAVRISTFSGIGKVPKA